MGSMVKKLKAYKIRIGNEFDDEVGDLSVSIWWSEPRHNLNWYPIIQVDKRKDHGDYKMWETIYHRECGENPSCWEKQMKELIDFVKKEEVE